jgi:hypothetical protein
MVVCECCRREEKERESAREREREQERKNSRSDTFYPQEVDMGSQVDTRHSTPDFGNRARIMR